MNETAITLSYTQKKTITFKCVIFIYLMVMLNCCNSGDKREISPVTNPTVVDATMSNSAANTDDISTFVKDSSLSIPFSTREDALAPQLPAAADDSNIRETSTTATTATTATKPLTNNTTSPSIQRIQYAYVYNTISNDVTPYGIKSNGLLQQLKLPKIMAESQPGGFAVANSNKYVYLVNWISNNISMYKVNPSTGNLTLLGIAPSKGTNPFAITASRSTNAAGGNYFYVSNYLSHNVAMFSTAHGRLESVITTSNPDGTISSGGSFPTSIGAEPSGKYIYVLNKKSHNIAIYDHDMTTGNLTLRPELIPAGGVDPRRITFDKNNHAFVVNELDNSITSFIIDRKIKPGNLIPSTTPRATTGMRPMFATTATFVSGKSFVYVSSMNENKVWFYEISKDGSLTKRGTVPSGMQPRNLYVNNNSHLYAVNYGDGTISMYKLNQQTGEPIPIGKGTIGTQGLGPEGMAFVSLAAPL